MAKKSVRVVIVEDYEPTAYLVEKAFRARSSNVDWDLCVAKDGEAALDCLFLRGQHASARLPDLILLDWNLPKISGLEVLRILKTSDELTTIPVFVFSASEADLDVQRAYESHANGYIPKPADLGQLSAVIEGIETFWVNTVRLHQLPKHRLRDQAAPKFPSIPPPGVAE